MAKNAIIYDSLKSAKICHLYCDFPKKAKEWHSHGNYPRSNKICHLYGFYPPKQQKYIVVMEPTQKGLISGIQIMHTPKSLLFVIFMWPAS